MTGRATWRRQGFRETSLTSLSKAHKRKLQQLRLKTPETEASTKASEEQDRKTQEKTKNQERGGAGQRDKGELVQSVQDTITFLHGLSKKHTTAYDIDG